MTKRTTSKKTSRRGLLTAAGVAGATGLSAALTPRTTEAAAAQAGSKGPVAPSILDYLKSLATADAEIKNTWRPDDLAYRVDMYRQTMMNLSYSYFPYFHADPEHPDWSPLWNPVYTDQPNPDDIYLYCPVRGDLTYRISGYRGTSALLTFTTLKGFVGLVDYPVAGSRHVQNFDHRDLHIGPKGEVDLILSTERPKGYSGDWFPLHPETDTLYIRYRSVDWANEHDPQLSIECLSPVPLKARLTPEQVLERIEGMAKFPGRAAKTMLSLQNRIRSEVGVNVFEQERGQGAGLSKQIYLPAVFEFEDGEALIIETDLPKVRPYWNFQVNDPYFNAVEYVYRLGSLNAATAKISSDGKLRAVISLDDPGVPNWLDPAGFKQGTIYGRWFDCDSNPMPIIKRVPFAELRKHLPADTPTVTPQQRTEEIRARIRAAQRRRRW